VITRWQTGFQFATDEGLLLPLAPRCFDIVWAPHSLLCRV